MARKPRIQEWGQADVFDLFNLLLRFVNNVCLTPSLTPSYTYAVGLSIDEALSAGAKTVSFNQPAINYKNRVRLLQLDKWR